MWAALQRGGLGETYHTFKYIKLHIKSLVLDNANLVS
jgi:hypothetical protein